MSRVSAGPPRWRLTEGVLTRDHERRAARRPAVDPDRIALEEADTAMRGRIPRQHVLVQRQPARIVEIEVPLHVPLGVDGAVPPARSPVQTKIAARRPGGSASGAHRSPAYEAAVFVRAERLRRLIDDEQHP